MPHTAMNQNTIECKQHKDCVHFISQNQREPKQKKMQSVQILHGSAKWQSSTKQSGKILQSKVEK